jgi:hypothetical protein
MRISLALAFAAVACGEIDAPRYHAWTPAHFQDESLCRTGRAEACGALGAKLVATNKRPAEIDRGIVLLEAACGLGDVPACVALGQYYLTQSTEATARARGLDLLASACRTGSAAACTTSNEGGAKN